MIHYVVGAIAALVVAWIVYQGVKAYVANQQVFNPLEGADAESKPGRKGSAQAKKGGKKPQPKAFKSTKLADPEHARFVQTLKGAGAKAVAINVRGNNLAVALDDSTVRIYQISKISDKVDFIQGRVEGDTPDVIGVSLLGDIVATAGRYSCRIFLFHAQTTPKRQLAFTKTFDRFHKQSINALHVCLNNIISCAEKDDTILAIWDFSGSVIDTYDTKQNTNYGFKISPDDKFFAVAAWVADVKVIEMKTARPTGAYAGHAIAMDLKGHKRGLIDLAFNEAANQMATASKDGTVNLFNINVRYNVGEDARLLGSFVPEVEVEFISMMQNCLVVASQTTLVIYEVPGFRKVDQMSTPSAVVGCLHLETGLAVALADGRVMLWDTAINL